MTGKRVVLTGGTDGIGKAAAIQLARLGASLVLMTRDPEKGAAALADIQASSGGGAEIALIPGDLASLASVRTFAAEVKRRYTRLDVLINNAGAYNPIRRTSADGFELTFAVNQLGPFLLTHELRDLMIASAPARIIVTASFAESFTPFSLDDIANPSNYAVMRVYGRSKRATLLFTYALARRLAGTGVTANAWHPTVVRTNMEGNRTNPFIRAGTIIATTPQRAARTLVGLAASPQLEGVTGKYFASGRETRSSRGSHSIADQERLWQLCESLTQSPAAAPSDIDPTALGSQR